MRSRDSARRFRAADGSDVELLLLFDRSVPDLENALDAGQFRLNCTPIVNLFPRTLDRIHVTTSETEHHVVPDLSRPMDFEVFSVDRVSGIGSGGESIAEVLPFYSTGHRTIAERRRAYYTMQRRPRLASQKQRRTGARTNYLGTECFLSLVDSQQRDVTGRDPPARSRGAVHQSRPADRAQLRQVAARFLLEGGAPVQTVRCLAGPTTPRPSPAFGTRPGS